MPRKTVLCILSNKYILAWWAIRSAVSLLLYKRNRVRDLARPCLHLPEGSTLASCLPLRDGLLFATFPFHRLTVHLHFYRYRILSGVQHGCGVKRVIAGIERTLILFRTTSAAPLRTCSVTASDIRVCVETHLEFVVRRMQLPVVVIRYIDLVCVRKCASEGDIHLLLISRPVTSWPGYREEPIPLAGSLVVYGHEVVDGVPYCGTGENESSNMVAVFRVGRKVILIEVPDSVESRLCKNER